jgi:hypothetical protein
MVEVQYTIDAFIADVDKGTAWYIQALKEGNIDYWNFNSFLFAGRPAIVTLATNKAKENMFAWDMAREYKGFIFWIPRN